MSKVEKGFTSELKNVEVEWVKLDPANPDDFMGTRKWCLNAILGDELAGILKKKGFNVRVGKDGRSYIAPYKKTTTGKGAPMTAPKVVGPDSVTPVDPNTIGNGSIMNVKVFCKKYPVATYVSMYIDSAQVVKLVEYSGGFSAVEEEDEFSEDFC